MTENEAIERIKTGICCEKGTARYCTDACMYGKEKCAYSVAIKALEEVQQYRAISTTEECRAAMGKQTAKRPRIMGNAMICPSCPRCFKSASPTYCPSCGQMIDWGNEE